MATYTVINFKTNTGEAPSPENLADEFENVASVLDVSPNAKSGNMTTSSGKWGITILEADNITDVISWEGITLNSLGL